MRKITAILLIIASLLALTACNGLEISSTGFKALYAIDGDKESLVGIITIACDNSDYKDLKKYAPKMIFTDEPSEMFNALKSVLAEAYDMTEDTERSANQVYDTIIWNYLISLLFDDSVKLIDSKNAFVEEFVKCNDLFKTEYLKRYLMLTEALNNAAEYNKDKVEELCKSLWLCSDSVSSDEFGVMQSFLQVTYYKLDRADLGESFKISGCLFDEYCKISEETFQKFFSKMPQNADGKISNMSLTEVKRVFNSVELPGKVSDLFSTFSCYPEMNKKTGVLRYNTDEYTIMFLGVPIQQMLLINRVTGEIIETKASYNANK